MNAKPITICPLPGAELCEKVRRLTEENAHTSARVLACGFLELAWNAAHRGEPGGNPFHVLRVAFDAFKAEHDRAGCLNEAEALARAQLWKLAGTLAHRYSLGSAFDHLAACL